MPSQISSRKVLLPGGAIAPATIEIEAGRILAVHEGEAGPGGDVHEATDETKSRAQPTVDYGERLITPAFVNAHTHLALTALRTCVPEASIRGNVVEDFYFRFEERVQAEDVRAFVRLAAFESLLAGVGLVWDHYYFGRAVAEGLRDAGLCGIVAPTLQDLAGPGRDGWEDQLAATAEIDDDAGLFEAGIGAAVGPHATDTVSEALLDRALEVAEARALPVHMHVAQSLEELQRALARHGTSPVGWLERQGALSRAAVVGAHAIYVSDADMARLRSRPSSGHQDPMLIWCPRAAAQFGFAARPDRWERAGVRWAIATDCAGSNDAMNPQQELGAIASLRAAAASHHGTYEAFLSCGTLEAARAAWDARTAAFDAFASIASPEALLARVWSIPGALHPRLPAGAIAPGNLANLIVWDLDHPCLWPGREPLRALALADATRAIHALWVAGHRIGHDGALPELRHTDAYRDALAEATARLSPLLEVKEVKRR